MFMNGAILPYRYSYICDRLCINHPSPAKCKFWVRPKMKSTKVQTLGGNIGIFGLKTTFRAYVLGEHTSMKNEL